MHLFDMDVELRGVDVSGVVLGDKQIQVEDGNIWRMNLQHKGERYTRNFLFGNSQGSSLSSAASCPLTSVFEPCLAKLFHLASPDWTLHTEIFGQIHSWHEEENCTIMKNTLMVLLVSLRCIPFCSTKGISEWGILMRSLGEYNFCLGSFAFMCSVFFWNCI